MTGMGRVIESPRRQDPGVNIEAEHALLGAALYENSAVSLAGGIRAEHFSEPLHGTVWAAIVAAVERGDPADLVTISGALGADAAFAELGGVRFLAELVDHAPPGAHAPAYASAVIEAWASRRIVSMGASAQADMRGGLALGEISARFRAVFDAVEAVLSVPSAPLLRAYEHRSPSEIPQRECLYGGHYFRRYVSTTTATAGIGKSALAVAESLAMVTGRPLLGVQPPERLRVGYLNLEDPIEETERRVAAAMLGHNLDGGDLGGRLFLGSGREAGLTLAETGRNGAMVRTADVRRLKKMVSEAALDVLILDPLVSAHRVAENDNAAMDLVVKTLGALAHECGVAIELIHHPRKPAPGQDVGVDDSRGASALLAAARSARTLNAMTDGDADRAGIEKAQRRHYLRADIGKSNLTPPPERATWFRLDSVFLGNGPAGGSGDSVVVVAPWEWPNPLEGVSAADTYRIQQRVEAEGDYRENSQAAKWIGRLVADVLRLDLDDPRECATVRALLKIWLENRVLVVERRKDGSRQERPFVSVGKWVTP
jgi:hypothetical protein